MFYPGSKARFAHKIASVISYYRQGNQPLIEPFCGSLSVTAKLGGRRFSSDANQALITTYTAMQNGWMLPDFLPRVQYDHYRATQDPLDPLTAVYGVIGSFAGSWFTRYCDEPPRIRHQLKSLARKMAKCRDVTFCSADYRAFNPHDAIIYCDPPYADTCGYTATGAFDNVAFWDTVRMWSTDNCVLVSEYVAPADFNCVAKFDVVMQFGTSRTKRTERVFLHKSYKGTGLFG